jgi:hypothetical protein
VSLVAGIDTCCTDGCERPGIHRRTFTVSGVDPSTFGEIEAVAGFCCEHIDMLDSDLLPVLDLRVAATERTA